MSTDSAARDSAAHEAQDHPPGPADHGREGAMATDENAPELTEPPPPEPPD